MIELKDNTVIVIDTANYKADYSESVPFKAVVREKWENEIDVQSVVTSKVYELYPHQILEALDIKEIEGLLDMTEYEIFYELKNK